MPKHSYQLINPVIEGTFKDVYEANEPIEAAKKMWTSLSEHIVAHVPKFMFTMRDISSGELGHFEVSENRSTNSFTINKRDIKVDDKQIDEYAKQIDKYNNAREQRGGKHHDNKRTKRARYDDSDSDSSSDSSSTDYPVVTRTSPIAMFHYTTRLYYANVNRYESTLNPQAVAITTPIFTPIFRPALGTFVGIWP
jgi:hypothetical protein